MLQNIKNIVKKLNIWFIVFSLLFGLMLIVSNHVHYDWRTTEAVYVSDFHFPDIIFFLCYVPLSYLGMKLLAFLYEKAAPLFFGPSRPKKLLVLWGSFFILMLLWIPYLMSYWPGGIYSDTVDSIQMALGKKELDNHNPLLYTMLWRFMFWVTGAFRDAGEYGGLKLFTVLQTAGLALALSFFLYRIYKKGIHIAIVLALLLFMAVFPLYPFYGISLWKDTVFSIALFLFTLFLYEVFQKKTENATKTNLLLYSLMTALIIFLRNNGIYISLFYSVILFLFYLKHNKSVAKKFGTVSAVVIVLSLIILGPVYGRLGYNIDTKTESLGIGIQQVAYIYTTDGSVSEQEKEVLNNILPLEKWQTLYNPMVVDYIKFDEAFNKAYVEEHTGEFLRVYASLVAKNPVKAVKAYFMQTMGFWDIFKSSPVAYICNFHFGNVEYFMSDYFDYHFDYSFKEVVEPEIYLSSAIFVWVMLATLFLCLAKKNYPGILCLLPTLGLWLSLMVAVPVAFSFRYAYALFLCTPMYVMVGIKACHKS